MIKYDTHYLNEFTETNALKDRLSFAMRKLIKSNVALTSCRLQLQEQYR